MLLSSAVTITVMVFSPSTSDTSNVVAFCPLMVMVAPALLPIAVTVMVEIPFSTETV